MRRSLLFALCLVPAPAFAAELVAPNRHDVLSADVTGGDLAKHLGGIAGETVSRRRAPGANPSFAAAAVPGWTITQIGDVVYLQDDGSHLCDGQLSQSWFESCMAGTNSALEAFYAQYPDADPGYVSFYLAWDINAFFAFYSPVANHVSGIGQQKFGNVQSLNGLIFMNSVQLYGSYGPSYREFMFDMIWGQEFGHRWGSFVRFTDGDGNKSKALLGRDDSHWSYFLDSDWSWMEGNDWTDEGGGKFTTNFDTFGTPGYGYSALDLYLMGLIPASGVPDFFYIRDPDNGRADDPPAVMYGQPDTIHGKKTWVSIDQVIDAEGERSPTYKTDGRHYQVANLVILRSTDTIDSALQADMVDYNEWTRTHFARDTFGLAHVETTIGTPVSNAAPAATLDLPLEAKEDGDAVLLDASGSTDPDADALAYVWDFGDGTADYTSGPTVEHVFRASGDITVTVVAVDARGQSDSASGTLAVANAPAKGGESGPLGIGCSVSGTPADTIPAATTALLLAAGALGLSLRRRRTAA